MNPTAHSALGQHCLPQGDDPRGQDAGERGVLSTAGLEAIYRRFAPRLVRHFARRVGREEASDVVHEAFAKLAAPSVAAGNAIESPEAFVATVATNVLRDRARAAARRALQDRQLAYEPHDSGADPHRVFEGREALRAIEGALARMSARRREIFLLHRFQEMTYAEIGGAIGMSEKGVKKQIAKALVALRAAAGRGE